MDGCTGLYAIAIFDKDRKLIDRTKVKVIQDDFASDQRFDPLIDINDNASGFFRRWTSGDAVLIIEIEEDYISCIGYGTWSNTVYPLRDITLYVEEYEQWTKLNHMTVDSRVHGCQKMVYSEDIDYQWGGDVEVPPYEIKEKERLNSNIYKNIFPEEVMDFTLVMSKMENIITSFDEIKQVNHGFSVGDIVYKISANNYGLALADNSARSVVAGMVTKVASSDIFTLMSVGIYPYMHLPYKDTTVLYLSDRLPGKLAHYLDLYDKVYIPVGIYAGDKIIMNIQDGSSGALLSPYTESEPYFSPYGPEDLHEVIEKVWDNA